MLSVGAWISKILCKLDISVNENFANNGTARGLDNGCLMISPERTMIHSLIDLDLKAVASRVEAVLAIPPDSRSKPLLGILRGQGGGKSRTLEEIRLHFWSHERTTEHPSFLTNGKLTIPMLYTALSVMARLIFSATSALYPEKVFDEMNRNLEELTAIGPPKVLLRGTVSYLVGLVRAKRTTVCNYVVLTDETARHEGNVVTRFPNSIDTFGVVREALLNEWIDEGLNISLIFSSLRPTAFGTAQSGRMTEVVVLPERLSTAKVVENCWKVDRHDAKKFRLMELCAAVLNDIPWALEIAATIVVQRGHVDVDAKFAETLIGDHEARASGSLW